MYKYRYTPFIKAKAGELVALDNLNGVANREILPVVQIGQSLTTGYGTKLAASWKGNSVAVDGAFNFRHTASAVSFNTLVSDLRAAATPTLVSVSVGDHSSYIASVVAAKDQYGAVVRCKISDLSGILGWISQFNWSPSEIDLIIDLKDISAIDVPTFANYLVSALQQTSTGLIQFRSVTLAGAAAPKDHTNLTLGANRVPRTDWMLWQQTEPLSPLPLQYGDYGSGSPDLTEPPGVAMANATVSARYSLPSEWLIIKGRQTSGAHGQPMAVQYSSHATIISADPQFGSSGGCWADGQIQSAAAGLKGFGSRQKWAEIAVNRHLSLVRAMVP